jgi:hypothetical protein
MQALYFPTYFLNVEKNEKYFLKCNHDEYSLWFDVFCKKEIEENFETCSKLQQPISMSIVSRNRLLQINDRKRNDMFFNIFKKVC